MLCQQQSNAVSFGNNLNINRVVLISNPTPDHYVFAWTVSNIKSLNRHNKISSPPFAIPNTSSNNKSKSSSTEVNTHKIPANNDINTIKNSSTVDFNENKSIDNNHYFSFVLLRGIIKADKEENDPIGIYIEYLPFKNIDKRNVIVSDIDKTDDVGTCNVAVWCLNNNSEDYGQFVSRYSKIECYEEIRNDNDNKGNKNKGGINDNNVNNDYYYLIKTPFKPKKGPPHLFDEKVFTFTSEERMIGFDDIFPSKYIRDNSFISLQSSPSYNLGARKDKTDQADNYVECSSKDDFDCMIICISIKTNITVMESVKKATGKIVSSFWSGSLGVFNALQEGINKTQEQLLESKDKTAKAFISAVNTTLSSRSEAHNKDVIIIDESERQKRQQSRNHFRQSSSSSSQSAATPVNTDSPEGTHLPDASKLSSTFLSSAKNIANVITDFADWTSQSIHSNPHLQELYNKEYATFHPSQKEEQLSSLHPLPWEDLPPLWRKAHKSLVEWHRLVTKTIVEDDGTFLYSPAVISSCIESSKNGNKNFQSSANNNSNFSKKEGNVQISLDEQLLLTQMRINYKSVTNARNAFDFDRDIHEGFLSIPLIRQKRYQLVPGHVKEEVFWNNYMWKVEALKLCITDEQIKVVLAILNHPPLKEKCFSSDLSRKNTGLASEFDANCNNINLNTSSKVNNDSQSNDNGDKTVSSGTSDTTSLSLTTVQINDIVQKSVEAADVLKQLIDDYLNAMKFKINKDEGMERNSCDNSNNTPDPADFDIVLISTTGQSCISNLDKINDYIKKINDSISSFDINANKNVSKVNINHLEILEKAGKVVERQISRMKEIMTGKFQYNNFYADNKEKNENCIIIENTNNVNISSPHTMAVGIAVHSPQIAATSAETMEESSAEILCKSGKNVEDNVDDIKNNKGIEEISKSAKSSIPETDITINPVSNDATNCCNEKNNNNDKNKDNDATDTINTTSEVSAISPLQNDDKKSNYNSSKSPNNDCSTPFNNKNNNTIKFEPMPWEEEENYDN